MDTENPKVFISHSSDDKDRFVRNFASRLRSKGIDAWIDEWEMQPGDSLIDKIFDEGIGEAQALIVVISERSIQSDWVREEINVGFVRRVTKKTRLIPVVIDQSCNIPVALQSTLYVKIVDLESYDQELERIVATIFGVNSKPELGLVPPYARAVVSGIPGLNQVDNIVLRLACENAIRDGSFFVSAADVWTYADPIAIPKLEMYDSIRILHEQGFIKGLLENRPTIEHFKITLHGFHEYAKTYIPEIDAILTRVAAFIVNDNMKSSGAIREATGQPQVIVEYAIELFKTQGWLSAAGSIGGDIHIADVSPQLRRQLVD